MAGMRIEAVPAYNFNKNFHPKANGWLGFIVEIDGVRVYHAGDTDFIPEMKTIRTDIALLPVSGTYVMTAEEAVQAALAINPAVAIPMHFGAIVGGASDAEAFEKGLDGQIQVRVLAQSIARIKRTPAFCGFQRHLDEPQMAADEHRWLDGPVTGPKLPQRAWSWPSRKQKQFHHRTTEATALFLFIPGRETAAGNKKALAASACTYRRLPICTK